ncbi:MAG: PQQ-dependent sugar dehydrogenase [Candidatus Thiodiazotropha sp. (ex Monitilora ramsayi)]|nr:PQQ-dependent sugar dehydrogenase [Candidatus Thiodiazotropha sp. (ex Monitilora ramsayi)]
MRARFRFFTVAAAITVSAHIAGCGGGSGGGEAGSDPQLQVDAGAARLIALPETLIPQPVVTLDGQTAGNQAVYRWRQIAGPGTVLFSDPAILSPTITFPLNGSYQLALDVSYETLAMTDTLSVTVNTLATGASGLSAPPANNIQCVAPADAATASAIRLITPFPSLPSLNPLIGLYQAPADNSTWYAVMQTGVVVSFSNDPAASNLSPFIDIQDRVDYGGEKGLLGMAFHPDYATNGYVYLSYTASPITGLESRISRFTLNTTTQTLDPTSEQVILSVSQPYSNHNGGQISFGPDNYLYIGLGDGGSGGDPLGHGQNTATLLGSMLRIDVGDGSGTYTIPPDNPFTTGGGAPEIYAYGIRNPWRWSFDRLTGDLWLGDVGQNAYEEVDIITAGGNFGWNVMEGNHCFSPSTGCDQTGLILPVVEYSHTEGIAVTGGYVYRGSDLPFMVGRYLYADYGSGKIWSLESSGSGGYISNELLDTTLSISAFAEDHAGELYVLHLGGTIHKIAEDTSTATGSVPAMLSAWGCFLSADVESFSDSVIPYNINALLWSDFAGKERFMAIPSGTTISIDGEGRLVYPPGSVLGKHFRLNGELIETRLLLHHVNSGWRGYSYEWNATLTDADLLTGAKDKVIGSQTWHYPSPTECLLCHTDVTGITLGPEVGQLNRDFAYAAITANQLITLESIGVLADPLTDTQKSTAFYAIDDTAYSPERRARSYLHSNCANCHQPGGPGGGSLDLRMSASFTATGLCNQAPLSGNLGMINPVLLKPGDPDNSILVLRMESLGNVRMPPLGTEEIDTDAMNVIRSWISDLAGCD